MVYLRATMTQRLIFHDVSLPEYPQGPRSAAQLAQAGAIT
jgi:hypothetical protein